MTLAEHPLPPLPASRVGAPTLRATSVTRRETNALAAGCSPLTPGHTSILHRPIWWTAAFAAPCDFANWLVTRSKVRWSSFEAVTCTSGGDCESCGADGS